MESGDIEGKKGKTRTRAGIGKDGSGVVYLVEIVAEAHEIDPPPVSRSLHRSDDGIEAR